MTNMLLNAIKNENNVAFTENGARAHKTTNSDVLDFFAGAGAYRQRSEDDIIRNFVKAFSEDALLTMKAVFYFRDIRGGQGERRTFRTLIRYMANTHAASMAKNVRLISEFGRWDDLYLLVGTRTEREAAEVIKSQFAADMAADRPSLLGKWLKSENASNAETVKLSRWTMKVLNLTPRQYRKALTVLRKKIAVVEALMSAQKWDAIEFDKLPSKAGLQYRKAFQKHQETRYGDYLASLQKGEAKVNSSTLYPYELVDKVLNSYGNSSEEILYNGMWDALPDYFDGKEENSIVVADVSGSMNGTPMSVSVSLAMYVAERNKGVFHNHFITFDTNPKLKQLKGKTFCERAKNLSNEEWGGSTNVEGVFNLVLNTAIKNRLPQSEMPRKLYIVSDMEFNSASGRRNDKTLFQNIRSKFEQAGYEMPLLVFWNVNARNDQFPMTMDDRGVMFVSGCSPSIFKSLLSEKAVSAYDLMLETLNDERYSVVTV